MSEKLKRIDKKTILAFLSDYGNKHEGEFTEENYVILLGRVIHALLDRQLDADQKVLDAREAQHLKEKEEMIEAIESYSVSVNCVCGCWDGFKAKHLGK